MARAQPGSEGSKEEHKKADNGLFFDRLPAPGLGWALRGCQARSHPQKQNSLGHSSWGVGERPSERMAAGRVGGLAFMG